MQDYPYDPFDPDSEKKREKKPRKHLLPGFGKDPHDDVDWAEQQDPEGEAAERKKDLRIVIVWAVIVMALLAAFIVYLQVRKTRVSLNEYLEIETEGYDSVGKAVYRFDADSFIRDYKEILRYRGGKPNTRVGEYANAAEALLNTCVGGSLTKDADLSNGDTITFAWDCSDEIAAEDYHCVLVYSNIDAAVENLTEAEVFDPFTGVTVEFSGISPEGTAEVRLVSVEEVYQDLSFKLSRAEHLQNGDTVKVSVRGTGNGDVADSLLRTYGMVPSSLEREYVVSGLAFYASALEEIPEDAMQDMQTKAEEVFREQEVPLWKDGAELQNREYLGSYLLVSEESTAPAPEEEDSGRDEDRIDEIIEELPPSGIGTALESVSRDLNAPFGWGEGHDDGEDEEEEDSGFHWSDLFDPSFYGFGSDEDSEPPSYGGTPTPTPVPEPDPEEENWNGYEDDMHTVDFAEGSRNILYLVYRVDVSLRGGETFSYYTYTAFSDILIRADGTAEVDLELWHVPTGSSFLGMVSGNLVSVRQGLRTYYFSGFETLNDLYRRCIYAQKDAWSFETDIE